MTSPSRANGSPYRDKDDSEKLLPTHNEAPPTLSTYDTSTSLTRRIWTSTLETLKPEILTHRTGPPPRIRPTAYLDGLRGVAAFLVVISHFESYIHPGIENCYGAVVYWGLWNDSPAALPILRVFFIGGHASVAIFFVISGYVVPQRLIRLLQDGKGKSPEFFEALNSAFVRRPGRLMLPVLWSTLALVFIWHGTGIEVAFPQTPENFFADLYAWVWESLLFAFPWREGVLFTNYNYHTWTIPVELRGSIMIFAWLFVTHQLRTRARILLTLALVIYLILLSPGAWYACFFAGTFTAELDMLAEKRETGEQVRLPWDGISKWLREHPRFKAGLMHFCFIFGMYLAGQPSDDIKDKEDMLYSCPGWGTLGWMIPDFYHSKLKIRYFWFWFFWAGWLIMISVRDIKWLRGLFESRFALYLGKHSYALYLVHGPMIALFSERLFYLTGAKRPVDLNTYAMFGHLHNKWQDASWWFLPRDGLNMLEYNFLFCMIVSMPLILYVAEIGTKCLDEPSIKVSNWMWKKFKEMKA